MSFDSNKTINEKSKIAFYNRVSTIHQSLYNEETLKNQEDNFLNWFEDFNHGLGHILSKEINLEIYQDITCGDDSELLPEYQRMVGDIKEGRIQLVVVPEIDSIFQNLFDAGEFITYLSDNRVGFKSIKEKYDSTTAMGKAFLGIVMVIAQMESQTI